METEDGGAEGGACADGSCEWRGDGECDDGGAGAAYGLCAPGTDCVDCGAPPPQCAPGEAPPGGGHRSTRTGKCEPYNNPGTECTAPMSVDDTFDARVTQDVATMYEGKLGIVPEVSFIEEVLHILIEGVHIEEEIGAACTDWSASAPTW